MHDMEKLKDELREFARARDWQQFHTPKNLAMALSVEVAEIVELFQWLDAKQSEQLTQKQRDDLAEEIGDVMIYLTALAHCFELDPLSAAFQKLQKNELKYPADLVRGKSHKYTHYEKD